VALDASTGPANLEAAFTPQTKLVMLESPTNPMHRVCDVRAIAAVCRRHGAILEAGRDDVAFHNGLAP
jgi:cystathionine beta-lyase/cystathionine gamma-synthase